MPEHINESELLQLIKRLDLNLDTHHVDMKQNRSQGSNSQDGWVKVENNMIIVSDPTEKGKWPTIRWADPVIIKKNAKVMTYEDVVIAADKLNWEINSKPLYKIHVSDDKMEVYLHVASKNSYAWNLKDCAETNNIIIEAVEDKDILLESLRLTDIWSFRI